MKLHDIKIGMTVLYDRFNGIDDPIEAVVDSIEYQNDVAYVWISPTSGDQRYLTPPSKLYSNDRGLPKEPRVVALLKVKHLEAIADGFEEGDVFSLEYQNNDVFKTPEELVEFLKSLNLVLGYASGCWDYAVYRSEPQGIVVNVGPGDQFVIYEDGNFGIFAGVGQLKVIDNTICVGR